MVHRPSTFIVFILVNSGRTLLLLLLGCAIMRAFFVGVGLGTDFSNRSFVSSRRGFCKRKEEEDEEDEEDGFVTLLLRVRVVISINLSALVCLF